MNKKNLDYVFNPRSIAIAGVSSRPSSLALGGGLYLQHLLNAGFKGKIYPVNPKGGEILNLKIYQSIKDIPGPVDYVVSCISASQVPQLIRDCVDKRVRAVHVYSAGFSESGTKEGKKLENEISSLAHEGGLHIIGPNCLGVYCPKTGLAFDNDVPKDSGPIGLVTQSGGNATSLIRESVIRGIRFSKVISYGNGCDVNESDLLKYFASDPDTKIITVYIEGVKDGKRFCQVLREAAKVKPVIMLKGGASEAGARAAASHTGALAGSDKVWDALLRQSGVVRVYSLEELIDMAVTFTYLPPLSGKRVGILGEGGGASVLATDHFAKAGLKVPYFPPKTQAELRNHSATGGLGLCLRNPVDLSGEIWNMCYYCAKRMLDYEEVDLLVFQLPLSVHRNFFDGIYERLASLVEDVTSASKESGKAVAIVIPLPISDETYHVAAESRQKCYEAGLPVYFSLEDAAEAIARAADYYERRARYEFRVEYHAKAF